MALSFVYFNFFKRKTNIFVLFLAHVCVFLPNLCLFILQDVASKILSISQKGSRGICVLSANGAVSNVTIRQPGSSGGILTYEV